MMNLEQYILNSSSYAKAAYQMVDMDWKQYILNNPAPIATLIVSIIGLIGICLTAFLTRRLIKKNSYLAEKGKNAATKEDIEEINRKLESIRSEYTTALEVVKYQLTKRATIHRLQVEKEFEVLSNIWIAAVELRDSVLRLRPCLDLIDLNEPKQERWRKRYNIAVENYDNLRKQIHLYRPFYPTTLFMQLNELVNEAHGEIVDFEACLNEETWDMSSEGYKRGEENKNKILNTLNDVLEVIKTKTNED